MKFKTKIFLDRTVGRIVCLFFAVAALALGKILKRDHSIKEDNVGVIAVAKYFGLGSITHAVPMLRALKNKYPKSKVIFITRKNNREIITLIPYIDEAFYIDDKSLFSLFVSNAVLIFNLQRKKIDLFFDLEVFSTYGVLVSLLSLARNRLGFFFAHITNFKTWLHTHLMYFNFQMPLRLSYMQLARLGGAAADASTDLENFKLSQAARVSAKKRLSEILKRPGKAVIGINVNCGELSFARRWKPENFAKVADYFAGNGYNVLLFGSPSERNYVEKSFEYIGKDKLKQGNIHNIAGIFSFEEVLAVLQTCDAFLTNDSGLMNLAYAQNAKVIALYGPCAPVVYHMSGENNSVLYKKTYCSPCVHIFDEPPCSSAVCMDNISPEEAIEAVERQLKNGSAANADDKEECIMVNKEHDYIMGTLRIQP